MVNWDFSFDPYYWDLIHFLGSYFLVSVLHSGFNLELSTALVLAFSLGVLWELRDVRVADGFGIKDLTVDGAGIGLYWRIHIGAEKHR